MKRTLHLTSVLCLASFLAQSQSTMEFQSGTNIEVTSGADICADNVIISGTYSGSGTQCGGALPVELTSMTAIAGARDATLTWRTETETGTYGFEVERRMVQGSVPAHAGIKVQGSTTSNVEPGTWNNVGFVKGVGTSSSPTEYSFVDRGLPPGRYAYRIKQIDQNGSFAYTQAVETEVGLAPKEFTLGQNYPNPFNPTTTIEFTLPEDGHVLLKVYDVAGHEVANLVDEERKAGVYHQILFDASRLGSGAYFLRIAFGGKQLSRKMLLLK